MLAIMESTENLHFDEIGGEIQVYDIEPSHCRRIRRNQRDESKLMRNGQGLEEGESEEGSS